MVEQKKGGAIITMSSVNAVTAIPTIAGCAVLYFLFGLAFLRVLLLDHAAPSPSAMSAKYAMLCYAHGRLRKLQHTPGHANLRARPCPCSYNASKGGIDNLTRCMALALAPHNIRVNAVVSSPVAGAAWLSGISGGHIQLGRSPRLSLIPCPSSFGCIC